MNRSEAPAAFPKTIPCSICRTGVMTVWRDTERVVIYECTSCHSKHGDMKLGVFPNVESIDR